MKRILLISGALIIIIFLFKINLPMTKNTAIGVYTNKNYKDKNCCVEAPHIADTLILNPDGTFSSEYYGHGRYDIDYGILKTEINLNYQYEMGNANYATYFSNRIYEKPKIILNSDLNHYYEKIE